MDKGKIYVMEPNNVVSALTDGIGYEMFFYSLVGSVIHLMYKWINAINEAKRRNEPFYFINWSTEATPTFIFSFFCGIVTVFWIAQYWPPINITKSIVAGLLAGSAIFNLLPAATNPEMWKSIGKWAVKKFKPK